MHNGEPVNVSQLAREARIARSTLYRTSSKQKKDLELRVEIEQVLKQHPAYGHRRIAIELQRNKKQVLRIMRKFTIKPVISRKKPHKPADEGKPALCALNVVKTQCPLVGGLIWSGDFTYLKFHDRFVYLATILDIYTREIVGWHCRTRHYAELVKAALSDALIRTGTAPTYFHSDQGSEYQSKDYTELLARCSITASFAGKGMPWENGYQESFYSNFKLELGSVNQYETLGELIEAIARQIRYYNTKRIHSALKMPPTIYAATRTREPPSISNTILNNTLSTMSNHIKTPQH